MKIETLSVHSGLDVDQTTRAVTPPINLSTSFEREPGGSYRHGYVYTRLGNPNRDALEKCVSDLEGGTVGAAFSSGSAAIAGVFLALSPGDHVVAPDDLYHGTARILNDILARWGVETDFVDMTDPANVQRALRTNTRMVWVETPSNPLLKITDIAAVSAIAHDAGALCVCDNTLATPVLQRPFDMDVDLIVHSATKYLGGHGDALVGVVVAKTEDEFFGKIRSVQTTGGGVASPFECWLIMRGIRTLPYRVRAHCESAVRVARFLQSHSKVAEVHYPGLENHPGHELARQQMSSFGGVVSFQVEGDGAEAMAVAGRAALFTRATSLGSVESLIEHRASVEGPGTRVPENLLRLSIGLEHPDDLIEDLNQALG